MVRGGGVVENVPLGPVPPLPYPDVGRCGGWLAPARTDPSEPEASTTPPEETLFERDATFRASASIAFAALFGSIEGCIDLIRPAMPATRGAEADVPVTVQ